MVYPFIATEKPSWDEKKAECAYPIPRLWSVGVIRRHKHFLRVVCQQREDMFEAYEKNGGDYHGDWDTDDEEEVEPPKKKTKVTSDDESDDDDEDVTDSDDVFE